MAKTLYSIQMDFQKAKTQANKLEKIARDINRIANNEIPSCMRTVSSNWKGDNARAYVNKGQRAEENLSSIAGSLNQTANTIRIIAQNTYNAEKEALDLAKKRTYQ
ncbi:MAG: hypothetical protein HFI84_01560 [Eubacterium sp.]|nr:hypothetical protein [Eubacterium sp.]